MNLTHLSIGLNSPCYLFLICLLYFCLFFLHPFHRRNQVSYCCIMLHILLLPKDNLTHSQVFTQPYWFLTLVTTSAFPLHRHVPYVLPFSPHLAIPPPSWPQCLEFSFWVVVGLHRFDFPISQVSGSFFYICFSPYVLLPRVFSMWLLRWDQKFYPTCLRNPPACIPVGILKFVF